MHNITTLQGAWTTSLSYSSVSGRKSELKTSSGHWNIVQRWPERAWLNGWLNLDVKCKKRYYITTKRSKGLTIAVWLRSCSSVVMANKYSWRMPCAWKTYQRLITRATSAVFPKCSLHRNTDNLTGQIAVRNRRNFPRQTTLRGYIRDAFSYKWGLVPWPLSISISDSNWIVECWKSHWKL